MGCFDILFFCNASKEVGFGHLRRCLFLAEEIRRKQCFRIAFAGMFDDPARNLVRQEAPEATQVEDLAPIDIGTAVIDYMFDPKDMEAYDKSLISSVGSQAENSILISSARTAPPDLPVDVVIGHLLDSENESEYKLRAGLRYAPIAPEVEKYRPSELQPSTDISRVFIGLGNTEDPSAVHLVLNGLEQAEFRGNVDLLIPPALLGYTDEFETKKLPYSLTLHHDVPSVPALLRCADCMVGSYGHMTFEALALGIPALVVGTKEFMVDYANNLVDQGMLICIGHVDRVSAVDVATELHDLNFERRRKLSLQGLRNVDGKGLKRVAEEIRIFVNS